MGTGDLFRDAVGGHGCEYMADARGRARARVYFLSQISCTAVECAESESVSYVYVVRRICSI